MTRDFNKTEVKSCERFPHSENFYELFPLSETNPTFEENF